MKEKLKVALVHDLFTQWGGGERVLKTFSEIFPDAPIYLIAYDKKLTDEFLPGKKIIASFMQNFPGMPKNFKYYFPFMPRAIESFDFSDYNVVLSDSSAYAKGVVTLPRTKHICYLHTPTRYLTSDKENYIETAPIPFPIIGRPLVKALLRPIAKWDYEASKRPDYLICNSHYIAKRTEKYYGRKADSVIFPPVDMEEFNIAKQIADYWLVLGRAEPYKRTDLAIRAANKLGLKLKVVGGGTKVKELQQIAGPTVEFLGRVTDDKLSHLYSHAIGLIFPQLEDAGMTPLEAMASGRPVIAYGEGGALESVKAGLSGEFFMDQTTESLIAILKSFQLNKYNPHKIREHVSQFNKAKFKEKILKIVEQETTK